MQRYFLIFVLLQLCFCFDLSVASSGDVVRNATLWDNVLKRWVLENQNVSGIITNVVDYESVSKDSDFSQYITELKTASIDNTTETERFAFFLNVYNALVVHTIITNACARDIFGKCGEIKSIKDISNFPFNQVWEKKFGEVAGKSYSITEVENYLKTLHPINNTKEDPRLHFAIVRSAISCPNLRREAYRAEVLDFQLTDNMNNFLNDTMKGLYIESEHKKVILSPIFTWDKDEFVDFFKPNKTDATVLDYILLYLSSNSTSYNWLMANRNEKISINYFNYDWDLNAKEHSIPCSSKKRVCYTSFDAIITVGVLVVLIGTLFLARWIVNHKEEKRGYETLN